MNIYIHFEGGIKRSTRIGQSGKKRRQGKEREDLKMALTLEPE